MAFELNNRTKIMAGVAVLVLAGAGAGWFFFLQDEAPPPRAAAPAKSAAKAAKAAKAVPEAAKAPAAAPAAAAPAQAAKPAAKPIPTNPDQLIAEILETSGAKAQLQQVASTVAKRGSMKERNPAAAQEFEASLARIFEPNALIAEVAGNLKQDFDAGRMERYLEYLRQPIIAKMAALKVQALSVPAETMQAQMDEVDKNPPAAERAKMLERAEALTRAAGLGSEIGAVMGRGYVDGMLDYLQTSPGGKAALTQIGKGNARNARAALLGQMNATQSERIRNSVKQLAVAYRTASDAELAEYLKAIDTEIGEWGATALANALKPAFEKRGQEQGRAFAQYAFEDKQMAAAAAAPGKAAPAAAAEKPPVQAEEPKPAAAAPAAPAEAPAYKRPPNLREVYTRYNDVVTATVMRDRTAVKELLDDGKSPNVRQQDGLTPLMIAASNGDRDIAAMLLAKGADPNLRAGGRSALSIAKARGAAGAEMVQLLQRGGAKD